MCNGLTLNTYHSKILLSRHLIHSMCTPQTVALQGKWHTLRFCLARVAKRDEKVISEKRSPTRTSCPQFCSSMRTSPSCCLGTSYSCSRCSKSDVCARPSRSYLRANSMTSRILQQARRFGHLLADLHGSAAAVASLMLVRAHMSEQTARRTNCPLQPCNNLHPAVICWQTMHCFAGTIASQGKLHDQLCPAVHPSCFGLLPYDHSWLWSTLGKACLLCVCPCFTCYVQLSYLSAGPEVSMMSVPLV